MEWSRDRENERQLDKLGAKWTWEPNFPVSSLKLKESLEDNARAVKTINDAEVEKMVVNMKAGAIFPGITVKKDGRVMAGIHRGSAVQDIGAKTLGAYVVTEIDPVSERVYRRMDNTRHGMNISEEDGVLFCVCDLVENESYTCREANDLFFNGRAATLTKITQLKKQREVKRVLNNSNIFVNSGAEALSKMHDLIDKPVVLKAVANLVKDARYSTEQTVNLVRKVQKPLIAEKQELALAVIKKEREAVARGSEEEKVDPLVELKSRLARFQNFLKEQRPMPLDSEAKNIVRDIVGSLRNLTRTRKGRK